MLVVTNYESLFPLYKRLKAILQEEGLFVEHKLDCEKVEEKIIRAYKLEHEDSKHELLWFTERAIDLELTGLILRMLGSLSYLPHYYKELSDELSFVRDNIEPDRTQELKENNRFFPEENPNYILFTEFLEWMNKND